MISSLFEKRAVKGQQYHPKDPALKGWLGYGGESEAGIAVTPEGAEGLSAIFACVNLLSSTLSMIPLYLYERVGDKNIKAINNPLFNILYIAPNKWQTGCEFWRLMHRNFFLFGNGYAIIDRNNRGGISELLPLVPNKMMVFIAPDGLPAYEYDYGGEIGKKIYLFHEILHLKDYPDHSGYIGKSRVQVCQDSTGLYMAAERFSSKFFANGTVLSGVLQSPNTLGDVAYKRLKDSWGSRHTGSENAYKPAILEEGLTWQSISVDPEKAQLLDTRKHQVIEACRLYNVPPHMIQSLDNATFSNIEEQNINFATYSLMHPAYNLEQKIYNDLLLTSEKQRFFAKFDMKELTRGNSAARTAAQKEKYYMGAMNANEIRKEDGENPIEGGDVYYIQSNMMPANQEPEPEGEENDD